MFCQCGCGQLTPLAVHTNTKKGLKKGQPTHFIHGHWRRVRPFSKESIERNAAARRGAKRSEEFRRLISEIKRGKPLSPTHPNRTGDFHRGRKRSAQTCARISNALTGKKLSPEHCRAIGDARRGKPLLKMRGPNHPFWKGGADERLLHQHRAWAKAVKRRDNYTCQRCGCHSKRGMHAHHIWSFAEFPEKRYDIDNGVTLCAQCHYRGGVHRAPTRLRDLFF